MQIEWVETIKIRPNPKNPNKHSAEQIKRLANIIKYQGWRHPLIVDKEMMLWAGHGRLLAAKELGQDKVPIHIQEFQSEEQAYAFLVSDNAIASWAELDLAAINIDIGELGPDFDIDLLGIKGFTIETPIFYPGTEDDQLECPNCGHKFTT
jgi:ParB family transcriptional regulator, chromosome partitioning protein